MDKDTSTWTHKNFLQVEASPHGDMACAERGPITGSGDQLGAQPLIRGSGAKALKAESF